MPSTSWEQVRLRPAMFVRCESAQELSAMLLGYSIARLVHEVDEDFAFDCVGGPFALWLRPEYGWSMANGWARAIEHYLPEEVPLEAFFRLLDEFRASPPNQLEAFEEVS